MLLSLLAAQAKRCLRGKRKEDAESNGAQLLSVAKVKGGSGWTGRGNASKEKEDYEEVARSNPA